MGSVIPLKLPIIDFSQEDLKPGTTHWDSVCNDVRRALEDYGCLEAVYDSVTVELRKAIFGVLEDLFNLPVETKQRNVIRDKPYYGYVRNLPQTSLQEGIAVNDALVSEAIQSFTNLMWPEGNASFCEILLSYALRISELDKMVKKMVLQSLGVEKYFDSHVELSSYLLWVMKYERAKTNETQLDMASHTDKSFLTILHQNQVNGLEVQARYGEWIQVTPAASSFIVMIGDSYYAWSNGRLHCPPHRVMMSEKQVRYSIGLFSFSNDIIQCPEELVDEQHPLLFKPFDHIGFLYFNSTDEGRKAESALKAYCGV